MCRPIGNHGDYRGENGGCEMLVVSDAFAKPQRFAHKVTFGDSGVWGIFDMHGDSYGDRIRIHGSRDALS